MDYISAQIPQPGSFTLISLRVFWRPCCLYTDCGSFHNATKFSLPQADNVFEVVYNKLCKIVLLFHFLINENNRSLKQSIRPWKNNCSMLQKETFKHTEQLQ